MSHSTRRSARRRQRRNPVRQTRERKQSVLLDPRWVAQLPMQETDHGVGNVVVQRDLGKHDIVGAHRPSVSTAMGALAKAGRVSRRDDGAWILLGEPPEKLAGHRLAAALT